MEKPYFVITALFFVAFLSIISCEQKLSSQESISMENGENYLVDDTILIPTADGAFINAIVVRNPKIETAQPVILQHSIYVRDWDINTLKQAVDSGYVGVMTYSRGKRLSTDSIFPYENEAIDTYNVIDWISNQTWCNGRVGMYGGSYNGYTQWAATKRLHPALKTIVPAAANRPGNGLPMENNVFINPNYEWSFLVGNNRTLDTVVGNDRQRFRGMMFGWWNSGVAYRKMDSLEGTPNRHFQRWLEHPSYDSYWQAMVPYKEEYARIHIPILVFDGYFNDSQNSSLHYFRELYRYRPEGNNYLIIGPYGHFGAQKGERTPFRGYDFSSEGIIDPLEITYQWFDYILKDGAKPAILKDRVNYFALEKNEWRSATSIESMANDRLKLYLSTTEKNGFHLLKEDISGVTGYLSQEVDFRDRQTSNNTNSYPAPLVFENLNPTNGYTFATEPFEEAFLLNGSFRGIMKVKINKKDFDMGITLFELLPDGKLMHLSGYIGRASYAEDEAHRRLLTPHEVETVPFSNTRLISKRIGVGSRILVQVDVNSNPFAQLNYGTGKDVSDESMEDANEPLKLRWSTESFIEIPVFREQ
ncbi:MAG: CocE/NonD family hydrolase [Bacteroidota bacterium]